mmetsp:Transcript_14052/g.28336  ORF Transcript_14052/g.28336 Transcript_14052/m.28336 type:complete len:140 (+) Transcript_14052:263-682(+)
MKGSPVLAGLEYFAVVFAIAFVLGAFRVIILVPRVGELIGVLSETPIILTVSWKAATSIIRKRNISQRTADRAVMGSVAFGTLMVAEMMLAVVAFGKTAGEFVQDLTSSKPNIIGLLGQVLYGLFPLIEGNRKDAARRV